MPLDLAWEEFDGSEILEALESMDESVFMEALELTKVVTRPNTLIPKCPNTLIPKCA